MGVVYGFMCALNVAKNRAVGTTMAFMAMAYRFLGHLTSYSATVKLMRALPAVTTWLCHNTSHTRTLPEFNELGFDNVLDSGSGSGIG
jgi:hypothetical protein